MHLRGKAEVEHVYTLTKLEKAIRWASVEESAEQGHGSITSSYGDEERRNVRAKLGGETDDPRAEISRKMDGRWENDREKP